MKRYIFLMLQIASAYFCSAQTNYLPQPSGNVGIGTTNPPSATLQVGSGTGNLHYGNNGVLVKFNNGDRALVELHSPDGQNRLVLQSLSHASYLGSMENKPLILQGGLSQGGGGNVGVGTTAPRSKLDIWGGALYITGADQNGTLAAGASGGYAYIGCNNLTNSISISPSGNVGIGAINPYWHKLAVNGSAIFTKVVVKQYGSWPDYVFSPTYKLPSLNEVETFIKLYKHLPEVPSAKEVEKNGLDLGENQAALLKKIEEQMLYIINLNKRVEQLEKENTELKKMNLEMENIKTALSALIQESNQKK
jgi:hypothetical protein